MKIKLIITSILLFSTLNATTIKATGSSLAAPLFYSWAYYFYEQKNLSVNYESSGSFAGIKRLKLKSIDFASSDKILDKKSLEKIDLIQFPIFSSEIEIVHNILDLKDNKLKLSKKVLSKIFEGKILFWDDEEIVSLNKNIKLPHKKITVVSREDSSGTTYNFTKFLNDSNKDWKENIGVVKKLRLNHMEVAKGNEGVSSKIKSIPNSIGYLPTPYRLVNELPYIKISDISKNDNYPISITNYIIVSKHNFTHNKNLSEFVDWIFKEGKKYALELGYIPLKEVD